MTSSLPRSLRLLSLIIAYCAVMPIAVSQTKATTAKYVGADPFAEARKVGKERSSFLKKQRPSEVRTLQSDLDSFAVKIKPILESTCEQCHGEDAQEGNLRIDTLDPDLQHGKDADWWTEILAVVSNSEMPPPDDVEMEETDRALIVDWLSNEIQVASLNRRATGEHSSFRRMTRYEINYALQDLLGLPFNFAKDLPPESISEDGFQNSSELLHITAPQLETFRQLARKALLRATVKGDRPPVKYWRITVDQLAKHDWAAQDKKIAAAREAASANPEDPAATEELLASFQKPHSVPYFKNTINGRTVPASWNYGRAKYAIAPTDSPSVMPTSFEQVAILPRGHRRFTVELGNQIPDEGTMVVRVRASQTESTTDDPATLQLLFGWQASNEGRAVIPVPNSERLVTASPNEPAFYEWQVPLGELYPRNSVRKTSPMGALPSPSEYLRLVNNSVRQGPIEIQSIEVAAPVYDQWPPTSHQKIFFDSPNSNDEAKYAQEIISAFMDRAWRRPVSREEVIQKMQLYQTIRPQCESLEEAVVEVLSTVLASPNFLYLNRRHSEAENRDADSSLQPLSAHALANRVATFLWASLPDQELRRLADDRSLLEPEILNAQVTRMLNDPRAKRLSKHFVQQWLNLQLLEFRNLPRGYNSLKQAMQQEPIEVFHEMLTSDESALDFLHCNYTMANERLALHYGLANVKGNHFRRVPLSVRHQRGGLLTQAGLLTMNAAGDDSHPLKRGIWLLESLLNDPPPPPPPAVPEIDLADPEIAKMTLKEQIENHRNHAACMSCHIKIDPWGIAFENYDALGKWRNKVKGKPVDSTSTLINDQRLEGMAGLKNHLLEERQDQFLRALVHKLTTYSLGRPLTFADRARIDDITIEVRQQGDGLATMVRSIVMSDLFRTR